MAHKAPLISHPEGHLDALAGALGDVVLDLADRHDELSLTVGRDAIVDVLRVLRDDHGYQQLMEIAGVDYPDRAERFEIVYHLLSLTKNHRIRIRISTDESTPVPTVVSLWPNANWLEREIFDMYGVLFAGHPDLRRILTDYGFRGHPQRKDFPLTGYVEMRYSEEAKRVVYEPVELVQDFRNFDFMSPWEGADYVLPGDEKVEPAPPPVKEAKTTESPKQTGAGKGADKKAAKKVSEGAPEDSNVKDEAPEDTGHKEAGHTARSRDGATASAKPRRKDGEKAK